ncbi:MAG: zinc-binding dehydrogenase [Clostridiales bacterium]|nr:zinc-binding dehydrogenase [Bacillota bacterium]MCR5004523.1 zinc-binding dehydrogenase [Clostridiales bacterium]
MDINQESVEKIVARVLAEMGRTGKTGSLTPSYQEPAQHFDIPKRAKVAMLTALRRIEVKEYDIPEIGDDEMLVHVEGAGVCGTDVHEYKNDPFGLIPVVLGHEGTGQIVKMGKNITQDTTGKPLHVGDRIVTCTIPCKKCDNCLNMSDRDNLCENSGIYGLMPEDDHYHFNGWFGEYIIIRPGSTFFKVNDMSLKMRMLIEPAAVVVHAVERAKKTGLISFNSNVLIQGVGPIGMMLLAVVRTMGVENITVVDGDENRLQMAKRFGAKYTVNFKNYKDLDEQIRRIKEITGGRGADFAFQCTGVPSAAANVWKFVKRGGGLCEVGFFVDNGSCSINPHFDICNKEITLVGSWTYNVREYPITIEFLKRAVGIGLPIEELVTHQFGLNEMNEAMDTNMKQLGIKVAYVNKNF